MKNLRCFKRADDGDGYAELVSLLPQAVIEAGVDGTLIFGNRHALRLFGYQPGDDFVGKVNVFAHVAPESLDVMLELFSAVVAGKTMPPPECWFICCDGSRFPGIIYANLIISGQKPSGFRAVIADITEKKQAETALKESEEKYRLVVENANDTVIVVQDGLIKFASRNVCVCRSVNDIIMQPYIEFVHPEDRQETEYFCKSVMEGSAVQRFISFRFFRNDGELRWAGVKTTRFNWEGKPALLNFIGDITERKRAEETLHESEKRYRDLAELLPQGIFEADTEAGITYVNRSALSQFGFGPEDIRKGLHVTDVLIQEDRQRTMKSIARILSGEKLLAGEYTCRRKNGTVFPALILADAIVKEDGERMGIRGVVVDITLQKQMSQKIEESEVRYRTLFEATGTSMAIIEQDGTVSLVNSELEKMTGYSKDEMIGTDWSERVHKDDLKIMKKYRQAGQKYPTSAPRNHEFRIVCKDGSIRDVYATIGLIPGAKSFVMSMIDITKRKRVEEEVKKQKQEIEIKSINLEEANTALRVLLHHREEDKIRLEEKISANLKELVIPCIHKLRSSRLNPEQMNKLEILETNLKDILSPFLRNLTSRYSDLTPREIEIISLIKTGRTTKEISNIVNASIRTIDFHRDNIRKKLGLKNKRVNLRSFLLSVQ